MDQTTETADLTETEQYLMQSSKATMLSPDSSDIDDDEEVDSAQDALLGGIRCGLSTMTKTARTSLSTCKNKMELDDAIERIQASSLNLLKLEKSFLKTASIVSEIVDDLVSDFDEEDDDLPLQVCGKKIEGVEMDGAGDAGFATSKQQPYIFRPSKKNVVSIDRFKEKLKTEYHKRMDAYKEGLTEEVLKEDKKFEELLKQIKLGKNEAETAMNNPKGPKKLGGWGQRETPSDDDNDATDNDSFLASLPYTAEELKKYRYTPYDEDKDMDPSVLPCVDPISKQLIVNPVKNKFCNHVFDKASIYAYIAGNDNAKCPIHMCRNKRKLERSHFVMDAVLTAHIRLKNNF